MKKALPYFLLFLFALFLSGCGDEPVNPSVIECNEDLSPVMGCEIKPQGELTCEEPPEIIQRALPNMKIVIIEGAQKMYNSVNTETFQKIISAVLLLYLVIYGFWVTLGMTNLELGDVITKLIRISIIIFFVSETGTSFYFDMMEKIWITGPDQILNMLIQPILNTKSFIMSEDITSHQKILEEIFRVVEDAPEQKVDSSGKSGIVGTPFMMLDLVLATIFSGRAIAFYVSLWTYDLGGKLMFLVVVLMLIVFVFTICKALWQYIIALLFRAVLIGIGFVFILLSLFKKTREKFFGAWILRLLTYTFQPIFLLTFLGMMTVIMLVVFLDLTEGQFGGDNERTPSSTEMWIPKNRACYQKYEALLVFETWAWRNSKHDDDKSIVLPLDYNDGWTEVPFMLFLCAAVIWMSYKSLDAAKMIPELMFAFAPIAVEAGVGSMNLPGMARQTGHSALVTAGTASHYLNPMERRAMGDMYGSAKDAGKEGAGMLGQMRAGVAAYGKGKFRRSRIATPDRFKKSWGHYWSMNSQD